MKGTRAAWRPRWPARRPSFRSALGPRLGCPRRASRHAARRRVAWLRLHLFFFSAALGLSPAVFAAARGAWHFYAAAAGGCLAGALALWLCDYAGGMAWGLGFEGAALTVLYAVAAGLGGSAAVYGIGAFLYGALPPFLPAYLSAFAGQRDSPGLLFAPTAFAAALQIAAFSGVGGEGDYATGYTAGYAAYSGTAAGIALLSLVSLAAFGPGAREPAGPRDRFPRPAATRGRANGPPAEPEDEPPGSFFRQPQFPLSFEPQALEKATQTATVYRASYVGRTASGVLYYKAVEETRPVHFPSGLKVLSALSSGAQMSSLARAASCSASAAEASGSRGEDSPGGATLRAPSSGQFGPVEELPRREDRIPRSYHVPIALRPAARPSPASVLARNLRALFATGTTSPVVPLALGAVSEFCFLFTTIFCQVQLRQLMYDLHEALVYICPVLAALCALACGWYVATLPKLSVKAAMGLAFVLHLGSAVLLAGTGMGVGAVVFATAALACGGAGLALALASGSLMLGRRPGLRAPGVAGALASGYCLARLPAVLLAPLARRASRLGACLALFATGSAALLGALALVRGITDYTGKRVCRASQAGEGEGEGCVGVCKSG